MIAGYTVTEELLRGETGALARAIRDGDGAPVLLKTVALPRADAAGAASVVARLRREYDLVRELDGAGLPRALAFERDGDTAALVLADVVGVPLLALALPQELSVTAALCAGAEIAAALAALHRRGIVHGHVTPAAVLVDPARGRATLVELGDASRGAQPPPTHPAPRHGAVAYLAPEQTGRTGHAVDHRADLYSLGATLYYALTGRAPFESDDPLEVVHGHLARPPSAPTELNASVPGAVSEVVLKLLAKAPDERYQSADGARSDLVRCAAELEHTGDVAPFAVGAHDVADRLVIPPRFYGRARDVARLTASLDRVRTGGTEMVTVAGYAGIGKTTLVREVFKPLVADRGRFLFGKFDQIVHVPFEALIQALRGLVRQLLGEPEEQLGAWRARLAHALGGGAPVLAEVVPELELLLGRQPSPVPVGTVEAQNRFRDAFQNLLRALTARGEPVVLFLDDLQWADAATLELLTALLVGAHAESLLVVGAYRDNEVDDDHPLARALESLERVGARLERVALGPLGLDDMTAFLSDALRQERADVEPLAALVLGKTGGNPFFATQLLTTLHEAGLITSDRERGRWAFSLSDIAAAPVTDNVVELMTRRIRRISPPAQSALTFGACIGSEFDVDTLATVRELPAAATTADLREALAEGLIVPAGDGPAGEPAGHYAFLHDRVQQAAYELIPAEERRGVHLTIGRLLRGRWGSATDDRLFDVVYHLNLGRALITARAERLDLARLDLAAARRAQASTAYESALGYLLAALDLVGRESWDGEYDLLYALHFHAAECEYLCGKEAAAERRVDALLVRARTRRDQAGVYGLRIVRYEYMTRYLDAIRVGREALALFGAAFPEGADAKAAAVQSELAAIRALVGPRSPDALARLAPMEDPDMRALIRLHASLHTPCYLSGDKALTLLNTAAMVHLSLTHGNAPESALGYALYAMHLGQVAGELAAAYDYGTLALTLSEQLSAPGIRARVAMNFSWAISIWRRPFAESFAHTREAIRLGTETGQLADAGYALFNESYFTLFGAPELAAVEPACDACVAYLKRVNMLPFVDAPVVIRQWARALQGRTEAPVSLTDGDFDEAGYSRAYQGQALFEMFRLSAKLALLVTFGQHREACAVAEEAQPAIAEYAGTIWDELRAFHYAIALAGIYPRLALAERRHADATLDECLARLAHWAANSPANFQAQHLVAAAEVARARGGGSEALALYDAAIEAAALHASPRELAFASERCAQLWLDRRRPRIAAAFLTQARDGWARWGAWAKVAQLERDHAALFAAHAPAPTRWPVSGSPAAPEAAPPAAAGAMDLASVMKAAQAIAGEIELESLLGTLMRITIENAGAERGSLVLEHAEGPLVCADGSADAVHTTIQPGVPLAAAAVPASIVNYVRRTRESVVLADASADGAYGGDPYVAARQPRSVLCAPLLNQGRLTGVLYLENNLAPGAFTPERLQVVRVLASHAAIAITNARLFAEVTQLHEKVRAENVYLQEEIRTQHGFEEIVGRSAALRRVLAQVEQVAPTDASVLIFGETGTGKELVARAIHATSRRRDGPMVTVNCGAISAGLVESEFFGHEKGAFTGAVSRKIGRFELADRGTIFLDEIGDLPLDLQVKLLRVLQEGEIERVGGARPTRVDVRVIAATHHDLDAAVRAGRFRSDLYYRLNVFPIRTPPLRERPEDIPTLVRYFVTQFGLKLGKRIEAIPKAVLDSLVAYPWPGNVRELRNVIERSVIITRGTSLELGDWIAAGRDRRDDPASESTTPARTLEQIEREHILATLGRTGWRVSGRQGAAQILGLKPTTLEARMKRLGISRPSQPVQ